MYRRLWTMGLRACTHPDMRSSREREREWAHRYVNARAYVQKCIRTPPLSRVRERFRAYGRAGTTLPLPPTLFVSLSPAPDRGNLRARHGEPDMTAEFESEAVFSRGFDRHALNFILHPYYITVYRKFD